MRNLLRFFIKHHFFILFLFLEIIAFSLLIKNNSFQNASLYKLKYAIVGRISEKYSDFSKYLSLREQNDILLKENAKLYNELESSYYSIRNESFKDSLRIPHFKFYPAKVINNSVNKQYNYITLDKGSLQGIKPEMGVIGPDGLVGKVKSVTKHFSSVIPIINREIKMSARIKNSNFFGPIEWQGYNYRKVILKEIPLHAIINIGDTIETSGVTITFPAGIMIGTVTGYDIEKGVNYHIKVNLSTDFKKLTDVMVIENLLKDEQQALEDLTKHD
jgi:rod shape-determining protein MreC